MRIRITPSSVALNQELSGSVIHYLYRRCACRSSLLASDPSSDILTSIILILFGVTHIGQAAFCTSEKEDKTLIYKTAVKVWSGYVKHSVPYQTRVKLGFRGADDL